MEYLELLACIAVGFAVLGGIVEVLEAIEHKRQARCRWAAVCGRGCYRCVGR